MANEIETHEEVCAEMRSFGNMPPPMFAWCDLAERAEAAHKREIDELKKQVNIAKDAFFKIVQCGHSQAVHDIVCEAEFLMNHPECRNEVVNG